MPALTMGGLPVLGGEEIGEDCAGGNAAEESEETCSELVEFIRKID